MLQFILKRIFWLMGLMLLFVVFVVPKFLNARSSARRTHCINNMKLLSRAFSEMQIQVKVKSSIANGEYGEYPFLEIWKSKEFKEYVRKNNLFCPGEGAGKSPYLIVVHKGQMYANHVIFTERLHNHLRIERHYFVFQKYGEPAGICATYMDSHVSWMNRESAEELSRKLKEEDAVVYDMDGNRTSLTAIDPTAPKHIWEFSPEFKAWFVLSFISLLALIIYYVAREKIVPLMKREAE